MKAKWVGVGERAFLITETLVAAGDRELVCEEQPRGVIMSQLIIIGAKNVKVFSCRCYLVLQATTAQELVSTL